MWPPPPLEWLLPLPLLLCPPPLPPLPLECELLGVDWCAGALRLPPLYEGAGALRYEGVERSRTMGGAICKDLDDPLLPGLLYRGADCVLGWNRRQPSEGVPW